MISQFVLVDYLIIDRKPFQKFIAFVVENDRAQFVVVLLARTSERQY